MWHVENKNLSMIDLEFVGIFGNPMIDLTWMVVMYMPPEFRRRHERSLISRYWLNLASSGNVDKEKYTLEQCWNDYKYIGAAQLAILSVFSNPFDQEKIDWFSAFLMDHDINAENVSMPLNGFY
jgi:hypothetical protein